MLPVAELLPLALALSDSRSWTATLGRGTGSFRWLLSERLRISVRDMPVARGGLPAPSVGGKGGASRCGSMGARAGVVLCCSDRFRRLGSS